MKQVSGNLWFTTEKDETKIGFTRSFIAERLSECFHVLPADTKNVKEKGPLLVLETNDGLEPVCSPVTGRLIYFNEKARNFPDRLTEEDCIVSLSSKELKKVTTKTMFMNDVFHGILNNAQQFNFNQPAVVGGWEIGNNQAQAAPQMPVAPRAVPELRPEPPVPVRDPLEGNGSWQARVSAWVAAREEVRRINRDLVVLHQRLEAQRNAEHRMDAVPPQRRLRVPVPRAIAWPEDLDTE